MSVRVNLKALGEVENKNAETLELDNGEIAVTENQAPQFEFNKVSENTSAINTIEFISKFLENNGYPPKLQLGHIEYDSSVNEDFEFEIIREANHDGTLLFTIQLLEDVVEPIIRKRAVHKSYVNEPLKDVTYKVGDIKLESRFENYRQYETVTLPIKCEYIYE